MFRRKKRIPKGNIGNHKFCPICGSQLEVYDTYCTRCGYSFAEREKRKKTSKIKWKNILVLIILLVIAYLAITYFTTGTILPDFITSTIENFQNSTNRLR